MTIVGWDSLGPIVEGSPPVAATIGVFDGVHRGHQALLAELGRDPAVPALVVTFRDNPKKVLNPGYLGDLMTWDEKVAALEQAGVQQVVVIDFSLSFSRMAGRDFFVRLKKSFGFARIVLGWDFSFGKDSATTAADLGWWADASTRLVVVPPLALEGRVVSSSLIRQAVIEGDLALARSLLGRPYSIPLPRPSVGGTGQGTLLRASVRKLLPPSGTYEVRLGGQKTKLVLNEELLTWESPPGEGFHEIVFV